MQGVTLSIALAASAVVFVIPVKYWLVVYMATLVWYPSYLTFKIATVDFTAARIVMLAIYANLFLQTHLPKQLRSIWLDKLIIVYFLCQIVAGIFTTSSVMAFLENRAGAVFDMVLPYFAVRMIVRSKKEYLTLLKSILIIAVPLAVVGFYQSSTGHNPVSFLRKYHAWNITHIAVRARHGFYRANVTFPEEIMFGLFFAMLGPACAGILGYSRKYRTLWRIGLGLMGVGLFSSMSSGPVLAAVLSIPFIAFYRWRRYWKPVAMIIVVMCGSVEIISNRHFYDVLGGFTFNPATAWYRSRLISVALYEGGMSGHWVSGFGYFVDPGWGPKIDGRGHTDLVNHYLLILSRYGLIGLLPFLAVAVAVVKRLVYAYRLTVFVSDRWLIWCLAAALFGLSGAMVSVSLFGQPRTILYILLGFCGAMPAMVAAPNPVRRLRSNADLLWEDGPMLSFRGSAIG